MKKICKLFSLAALAAFSLTSCMNDDNGGSVDPYANIRPGISIYNASVIQNSVATDPAAAAVRMAMLIDEAAVQDKSFDELTVIFRKTEISLKELLFGRGAMIEESEETPGEYRIRFVMGREPGTVFSQRFGAVSHSVRFDVGFVDHIEAVFVAKFVP